MDNLDVNIYLERKERYSNDFLNVLIKLKRSKDIRSQSWGLSVINRYNMFGNLDLFLNCIYESKKYFYKSTKLTIEIFKIFKENRYPNLEKKEPLPFTAMFINSFLDAILCDSEEMLLEYARTIHDDGNTDPPFNYEITSSMKYLILKDYNKAIVHANNAHQQKYFKLPYKGFSHVVKGILDRDINLINEGLELRIRYHRRENKDSIFYAISLEATALAKLAIMYDLQPDTSSPFIHNELLKEHKDIQYDGIDEILEALEVANRRNGNLLGKIRNKFRKN